MRLIPKKALNKAFKSRLNLKIGFQKNYRNTKRANIANK